MSLFMVESYQSTQTNSLRIYSALDSLAESCVYICKPSGRATLPGGEERKPFARNCNYISCVLLTERLFS